MPNHSSPKKALKQSLRRKLINKSRLSKIKTLIKKTTEAISSASKEQAVTAFVLAQSEIMKGKNKKLLKPNNASNKVSKLAREINKL